MAARRASHLPRRPARPGAAPWPGFWRELGERWGKEFPPLCLRALSPGPPGQEAAEGSPGAAPPERSLESGST